MAEIFYLDIAKLKAFVEHRQLMLYPVLLFLIQRLFNEGENRYHLCYEVFQENSGDRAFQWCAFQDDFEGFYQRFLHDFLLFGRSLKKGMPSNVIKVFLSHQFGEADIPAIGFLPCETHELLLQVKISCQYENLQKRLQYMCDNALFYTKK